MRLLVFVLGLVYGSDIQTWHDLNLSGIVEVRFEPDVLLILTQSITNLNISLIGMFSKVNLHFSFFFHVSFLHLPLEHPFLLFFSSGLTGSSECFLLIASRHTSINPSSSLSLSLSLTHTHYCTHFFC